MLWQQVSIYLILLMIAWFFSKNLNDLKEAPFIFAHKQLGWTIVIGYNSNYTLEINNVKFEDMDEA